MDIFDYAMSAAMAGGGSGGSGGGVTNLENGPGEGAIQMSGAGNTASGLQSVALGSQNQATDNRSMAFGEQNTVSGYGGMAFGSGNTVQHWRAIAIGTWNQPDSTSAIAIGSFCKTYGEDSVAIGYQLTAYHPRQMLCGQFNDATSIKSTTAYVFGNGTSDSKRSNAHTLDWSGNAWYAGSVECTALIMKSPNGTRYQITVDDSGTLSATTITE